MLKITQGHLRGRSLSKKLSQSIRPTSAKIREAIFQILKPEIEDSTWLDLCAGSGIMGIEALSCGAKDVIFVEKNFGSVAALRHHIKDLNLTKQSKVINTDVKSFLKRFHGAPIDFIFFDPPYNSELYIHIFDYLKQQFPKMGSPKILVEHSKRLELEYNKEDYELIDFRSYGESCISFFLPSL